MQLLDILLLVVSILLITLVVMQSSKDNVNNAFSGEKSELFKNQKERGPELFLTRLTMVFALLFLVLSVVSLA